MLARMGGGITYNGDDAVGLEQRVEVLQKLEREQSDGLGSAREDVVDDVVEAGLALVGGQAGCVADSVFDHGGVVAGELEVLGGELVDDRINLDHGCVDTVGNQGSWGCADAESASAMSACFNEEP